MDIMYSLNSIGFSVDEDLEVKDLLYWYASYQKDKEKTDSEKKRIKNKNTIRR